ncbi:MAG: tRNA (N6-threonylcarbamoyladenosine(37)-N6)-methyltransferase TrmO [Chloroflexi bacterium B3_Chlor]|nr:MAG: tRNA (N6-threonylcarbamoyladenosine(37)-N6)-methyltransferase TrmO [Chloroflexi bacterium B3_Chlor]
MTWPDSGEVLELRRMGHVENDIQPGQDVTWEAIESQIVIDPEFAEGLDGVEEFSHIVVLFWLDRPRDKQAPLKVHPEAREDMPLVGVFATRAPVRPNPIGLTTVELLGRDGNVLLVRGLDAYNGTPVLDIKPYLIRGDMKPGASVPKWLQRLWEEQDTTG